MYNKEQSCARHTFFFHILPEHAIPAATVDHPSGDTCINLFPISDYCLLSLLFADAIQVSLSGLLASLDAAIEEHVARMCGGRQVAINDTAS